MQGQSECGCSQNVTGKLQSDLPIQEALHKSDEEFFAASVNFLRKRLHEKKCQLDEAHFTSQSCVCLREDQPRPSASKAVREALAIDAEPLIPVGQSLSMLQVLPFPKSNKYGFFARLKNTFKKYRSYYDMESKVDSLDSNKVTSDFKFPLSGRINKPMRSSCLVDITEEGTKEYGKLKSEQSMCRTNLHITR